MSHIVIVQVVEEHEPNGKGRTKAVQRVISEFCVEAEDLEKAQDIFDSVGKYLEDEHDGELLEVDERK